MPCPKKIQAFGLLFRIVFFCFVNLVGFPRFVKSRKNSKLNRWIFRWNQFLRLWLREGQTFGKEDGRETRFLAVRSAVPHQKSIKDYKTRMGSMWKVGCQQIAFLNLLMDLSRSVFGFRFRLLCGSLQLGLVHTPHQRAMGLCCCKRSPPHPPVVSRSRTVPEETMRLVRIGDFMMMTGGGEKVDEKDEKCMNT